MNEEKKYNDSEILNNDSTVLPEKEVETNASSVEVNNENVENIQAQYETQEKANACEKDNNEEENKDSGGQGEDSAGALHNDYVSEPAEYVWNSNEGKNADSMKWEPYGYGYTQSAYSYSQSNDNAKKKNKKGAFWLIAAIILASALSIALMLGFITVMTKGVVFSDVPEDAVVDGDKEVVNMTKNDSPIEVKIENGSTGYVGLTRAEVVSLVADAVVEITTSRVQTSSLFGGNYVVSGAGSGVVIAQSDEYAYVVTNYHVIDGATSAKVTLTDGTTINAEYLDGDESFDIAMLRIKTDREFPKIVCGSSDSLKVGDDVIAIGNPLGRLGGTVTEGIVSALDRELTFDGIKMELIQTSAAVNPGNSGGGLFNMAGELVGIVNSKQAAEGIEGLGFAVPIDNVYDMLVEIIESKYIHGRPTLGIEVEYASDALTAYRKYGLAYTGVYVTSSSSDVIKTKDLIYSVDGQLVTDASSYAAAISSLTVGEKVTVEVYRNSRMTTVEVEVTEYVPAGMFG